MSSETFFEASNANLLLGPIIKFSNFLFGSILLYWKNESLIKEMFLTSLYSLVLSCISDIFFFRSLIVNSILLISFLWIFTICKIWSKYLDAIQSLINLVDTEIKI